MNLLELPKVDAVFSGNDGAAIATIHDFEIGMITISILIKQTNDNSKKVHPSEILRPEIIIRNSPKE